MKGLAHGLLLGILLLGVAGAAHAAPIIYTSTDTPLRIPEDGTAGTIFSVLIIPDSYLIDDVNVRIDIDHTFLGDLRITLVSPVDTTIRLFDRRGGSGDNLANTIFDDEAALPITSGSAPFAGSFRPEQPLSALIGENVGGNWTLLVEDLATLDSGFLKSWALIVTPRASVPEPSVLALFALGAWARFRRRRT